ncbi:MAG: PorT family protein [Muribaculaceae bacterium]|nr:PorT family protein [Muribaculaceae bacterium]
MKRIVSLVAFLSFAFNFFASNPVLDNPDNSPFWGVRVGYDWSLPGKWDTPVGDDIDLFKSGPGVSISGIYNLPVIANLFFEPGLTFYYDQYAYKDLLITNEQGGIIDKDPKVIKYGLRIPLVFGYRFDFSDRFSISLFTGPQIGYAFSGKIKFKNKDKMEEPLPEELFGDYGQRRFNIDWNIGSSFEVDYHWQFSIIGSLGLNDIQKNSINFKENRVTFALGYNF